MSKWAAPINGSTRVNTVSQQSMDQDINFDAEIAMIEQRLLRIQKMKQGNNSQQSRNDFNSKMINGEQPSEKNLSNQDIEEDNSSIGTGAFDVYKTPKANTSSVMSEKNYGRPHKPAVGGYRNVAPHDGSFTTDEDMTIMANYNQQQPAKISQLQMTENSDEAMMKRSLDEDEGQTTEKSSKYIRMDPQEGRLLGGYYTPGQKEKLMNFMPAFWNIGNPMCPQEIIGIRKNTQFYAKGKGKAKLPDEKITYLVVSFENRKTKNSPFIEYPLNRLGSLIKALQDLKDFATENGYYNEGQILKSQYPDNTVLTAKDTRDTILETLNNAM